MGNVSFLFAARSTVAACRAEAAAAYLHVLHFASVVATVHTAAFLLCMVLLYPAGWLDGHNSR